MTVREEIEQLKKEKNAVILAHYYVRPEVQEIADRTAPDFKRLLAEAIAEMGTEKDRQGEQQ